MNLSCIEGVDAIMDAAKKQFSESQREKAAGSSAWWKVSKYISFSW